MRRFLLVAVVISLALTCAFAQAEGLLDTSLLELGLAGHPLTPDDVPETLSQISSAVDGVNLVTSRAALLQEQALEPLYRMMRAAASAGQPLYVRQAYRSYAEEERRYELLSASGQAAQKPGESSYQTGLSVTLVGEGWKTRELTADFADSSESRWLSEHAAEYGFVLRYPEGKEEITGWSYEPWHYRYVGVAAATVMAEQGLCLEEVAMNGDLLAATAQDAALPQDYYTVVEAEPEVVEGWDAGDWPGDAAVEVTDVLLPESDPVFNGPAVRDPSTINPEDIGPDGDYEISLGDL